MADYNLAIFTFEFPAYFVVEYVEITQAFFTFTFPAWFVGVPE